MYKKKISESQGTRGLTIRTIIKLYSRKAPEEERHSQRVKELALKSPKH
jgi:hypothetical protein